MTYSSSLSRVYFGWLVSIITVFRKNKKLTYAKGWICISRNTRSSFCFWLWRILSFQTYSTKSRDYWILKVQLTKCWKTCYLRIITAKARYSHQPKNRYWNHPAQDMATTPISFYKGATASIISMGIPLAGQILFLRTKLLIWLIIFRLSQSTSHSVIISRIILSVEDRSTVRIFLRWFLVLAMSVRFVNHWRSFRQVSEVRTQQLRLIIERTSPLLINSREISLILSLVLIRKTFIKSHARKSIKFFWMSYDAYIG